MGTRDGTAGVHAANHAREQRRLRALEEESARLKANAEQEAERRKAEEDEIMQQKQKLEEALDRVQAHSFRSVRGPASPRTKDSLVQKTLVYGAYGSPKAPPSPSAAEVSAGRASGGYRIPNSTQGSWHLAERLARLEAEHRADDERLERLRAERRAEEDELVHQLEEARVSEEQICRNAGKRLLPAPVPRSTGTEAPERAVDVSPARSAQAGLSLPLQRAL